MQNSGTLLIKALVPSIGSTTQRRPLDPAVVTVGSFHGGSKHNIIPNEVHLQLTVRSYSEKSRQLLLDGIKRIARGEAEASGLPEALMPVVAVVFPFLQFQKM